MNFGEKLKAIRLEMGLNQPEFASILGTTKQSINRYENSERDPNLRTAIQYADRLGVSIVDLCDDSVTVVRRVSAPLIKDPAIEKYYSLDPSDRLKAEAYVDGLLAADKYHK